MRKNMDLNRSSAHRSPDTKRRGQEDAKDAEKKIKIRDI